MFKTLTFLITFIFTFSASKAEITFSMIKPHALKNKNNIKINQMIESSGLKILKKKRIIMTKIKFYALYKEHKNKPFFEELKKESIGKRIIVQILEGKNAVEKYRALMGHLNPEQSDIGTIRNEFGIDKTRNAVHGSDSKQSAIREISIFFPEFKLEKYINKNYEKILY